MQLDELVGHRADAARACAAGAGCGPAGRAPRPRRVGSSAIGVRAGARASGAAPSRRPRPRSPRSGRPPRAPRRGPARRRQERQRPEGRACLGRAAVRRRVVTSASRAGSRSRRASSSRSSARAHDPVDEAVAEQELGALEARAAAPAAIVPAETRAPAKPMSAFGSAMLTSPSAANEAKTPPVVGSRQDPDEGHAGRRAGARARRSVLASCISASVPSCIRAPPEALTTMSGTRAARACLGGAGDLLADDRAHRAAHEPEVHDADGDRDRRRWRRCPRRAASRMPVAAWAAASRSGYGLLVDEAERVHRLEARRRAPRSVPGSSSSVEPRRGRQAEVVAAVGADPQGLVELLVEEHLLARRALGPEVGRVGVAARAEDGSLIGIRRASSGRPPRTAHEPSASSAARPARRQAT